MTIFVDFLSSVVDGISAIFVFFSFMPLDISALVVVVVIALFILGIKRIFIT